MASADRTLSDLRVRIAFWRNGFMGLKRASPAAVACGLAMALGLSFAPDGLAAPNAKVKAKASSPDEGRTPFSHQPTWSYSGKNGPRAWGTLSDEFRTCQGGADQSPVDLRAAAPGEGDKLRFDYFATPLVVMNDGHALSAMHEGGSAFSNARGRFELARIDVRTPSEHTLAGKSFPMELQLVHRGAERGDEEQLSIVSVFVKVGKANPVLEAIRDNAPDKEGVVRVRGLLIDAAALLPRTGGYFYYPGSLTTPPCTEGVVWHVLKDPIEASKEQIEALRKPFKANARPVQPLRDRLLREM